MQGGGKATVDFREDRDARDALILNGRMWGNVQLEVTKTTSSGNYLGQFQLVVTPHSFIE